KWRRHGRTRPLWSAARTGDVASVGAERPQVSPGRPPTVGEEFMAISRWKVMAGVLGVSLGGLAAIAGQCPRSDGTQTQRADDAPLTAEAPRVPPAGAG